MVKYKVKVTPKSGKLTNPYHEFIQGRYAYLLEAKVGETAWFAYKLEEDASQPWHRVHTSLVESFTENEDKMEVVTENTTYTFIKELA